MKVRLLRFWENLTTSFWFVPILMAVAGALLAIFMIWIDGRAPRLDVKLLDWLYVAGPSGARSVLATIASSSITVASVVFSITIVALSTASNQFGPRLLPNFMQQGATQVALGTFIATFIYALLVLGRIPEPGSAEALPSLSVFVGMVAGIASFIVLILFIHHVATFIQAPRIIDDVARSLEQALDRIFPEDVGHGRDCTSDKDITSRARAAEECRGRVSAPRSGYLQAVDAEGLLNAARETGTVIRLLARPGDALIEGAACAEIHGSGDPPESLAGRIREMLVIGPQRTQTQDIEYAVDQLAEVALRALSPGINDPFTAINCLDRLGTALARLAARTLPSAERADNDGTVRLIVRPYTYAGIVEAAFSQLRESARTNATVALRMLDIIRRVAELDPPSSMREQLEREAKMVAESAADAASHPADRGRIMQRHDEVAGALEA